MMIREKLERGKMDGSSYTWQKENAWLVVGINNGKRKIEKRTGGVEFTEKPKRKQNFLRYHSPAPHLPFFLSSFLFVCMVEYCRIFSCSVWIVQKFL